MTVAADVSLDGAPVVQGDVHFPRVGDWTAWLRSIDQEAPPAVGAQVTLTWLGTALQGTVASSGIQEGRVSACIVGGRGGLRRELPARGYDHGVTVDLVLRQILQEAGESLDAAAVAAGSVPQWARAAGPASSGLDILAQAAGAVWRVTPTGAVWWGVETWPAAAPQGELLPDGMPHLGLYYFAPLTLSILPGQTWQGGQVGAVVYTTSPGAQRARVWLQATPAEETPLRAGILRLVRDELRLRGVDYLAMYPGQVVAQHADGTVDILPDSPRVPPARARLVVPVPGAKLTLPSAGARALLGYLEGDPQRAAVFAWEAGAGGAPVARVGDLSKLDNGGALSTWMLQVETVLNGLAPGSVAPLSSTFLLNPGIVVSSGSPHLALLAGTSP